MGDREQELITDGVLVQPISGQIYLVEEKDLVTEPAPWDGVTFGERDLSGLIGRH